MTSLFGSLNKPAEGKKPQNQHGLAVLGLLLLLTSPVFAGEPAEPQGNQSQEGCTSIESDPDRSVESSPSPLCSPTDMAIDVIRIPPVVVRGDRPTDNNHELKKYIKQMRKRIDQGKSYPFTAQQMRWEGAVLIKFTVSPQGDLLQTKIDRTSGFLILDEAAEVAVKKAFPVVPSEPLFDQPMEFKVPVMFKLH